MRGYIEIKETSYEDTLEQLHKIKLLTCKLIKMLSEHIEDETEESRHRGRYDY